MRTANIGGVELIIIRRNKTKTMFRRKRNLFPLVKKQKKKLVEKPKNRQSKQKEKLRLKEKE